MIAGHKGTVRAQNYSLSAGFLCEVLCKRVALLTQVPYQNSIRRQLDVDLEDGNFSQDHPDYTLMYVMVYLHGFGVVIANIKTTELEKSCKAIMDVLYLCCPTSGFLGKIYLKKFFWKAKLKKAKLKLTPPCLCWVAPWQRSLVMEKPMICVNR